MTHEGLPRLNLPSWLRFVIVFAIIMAVGFRRDLLSAMGYADAAWPRWIFAAVMATAFMVYAVLTSRSPIWCAVADRPRVVRLAYDGLGLIAVGSVLVLAFAGRALTNPIFWLSMSVILLLAAFEWLTKRKRVQA